MTIQTPKPTFVDFSTFSSVYDQIMQTGWLGYGSHAVHFKTATHSEIEAGLLFLERSTVGKQVTARASSFEEFVARGTGVKFRLHVPCAVGIADIVTEVSVIEVKSNLDRDTLFFAIGQVLAYRQAIDPALTACIVGIANPNSSISNLISVAKALGVEVFLYPPDTLNYIQHYVTEEQP